MLMSHYHDAAIIHFIVYYEDQDGGLTDRVILPSCEPCCFKAIKALKLIYSLYIGLTINIHNHIIVLNSFLIFYNLNANQRDLKYNQNCGLNLPGFFSYKTTLQCYSFWQYLHFFLHSTVRTETNGCLGHRKSKD